MEGRVGDCLVAAAELYAVPPGVLLSILNVEGGRLGAVSRNKNETVDIGPMQVNDSWIPKLAGHWRSGWGETYVALRDDFCANIEGGAWILRLALNEAHENLWEAVALYHSHTPAHKQDYLRRIFEEVSRLRRQAVADAR
jgi:soluble lytic murein transglycosylase-like protein